MEPFEEKEADSIRKHANPSAASRPVGRRIDKQLQELQRTDFTMNGAKTSFRLSPSGSVRSGLSLDASQMREKANEEAATSGGSSSSRSMDEGLKRLKEQGSPRDKQRRKNRKPPIPFGQGITPEHKKPQERPAVEGVRSSRKSVQTARSRNQGNALDDLERTVLEKQKERERVSSSTLVLKPVEKIRRGSWKRAQESSSKGNNGVPSRVGASLESLEQRVLRKQRQEELRSGQFRTGSENSIDPDSPNSLESLERKILEKTSKGGVGASSAGVDHVKASIEGLEQRVLAKQRQGAPGATPNNSKTNSSLDRFEERVLNKQLSESSSRTAGSSTRMSNDKHDIVRQLDRVQTFASRGSASTRSRISIASSEDNGEGDSGLEPSECTSTASGSGSHQAPRFGPGRRHSSFRHKSEVGLLPGQPIPGAYEAAWRIQPSWVGSEDTEMDGSNNVGSSGIDQEYEARGASHQTIPQQFIISPSPPSNIEPVDDLDPGMHPHDNFDDDNEMGGNQREQAAEPAGLPETKRRKQRKELCLFIIILFLVGVVICVVLLVAGNRNRGNAPAPAPTPAPTPEDDPSPCNFAGEEEPDIFLQCSCNNKATLSSQPTIERYNQLKLELLPSLYPNETFVDPTESCTPRGIALLWTASQSSSNTTDSDRDRYLLAVFYLLLNGVLWERNGNWLSTKSICDWDGITCQEDSSDVTAVQLPLNSATGQLPSELFMMQALKIINLTGNEQLSGSIPPSVGSLSDLALLDLHDCAIDSMIPTEIGNLGSLEILLLGRPKALEQLNQNQIPSELGLLSLLRVLDLTNLGIRGTLPTEIGSLSSLEELELGGNTISGTIPAELGSLLELSILVLSSNELVGTLPPSMIRLTNMRELLLENNLLNLGKDGFDVLVAFTNLITLSAFKSGLAGTLPNALFTSLSKLEVLGMASSSLSGTIPSDIGLLTTLEFIDIGSNHLTGTIPFELGRCTDLLGLSLQENSLSGSIPESFRNLSNLKLLGLHRNNLRGDANFLCPLGLDMFETDCLRDNEVSCSCCKCS